MTELLTIAMAAERCHVHYKTIERAIRNQELRASKLAVRGCWVIQPEDLEAWVEARANRPRTIAAVAPIPARPHTGRRRPGASELSDLVPPARRRSA